MAYKFWYLYLKFNGTAPLQEYSAYFKDWIQNEIKNTETIHELNIIYHTTTQGGIRNHFSTACRKNLGYTQRYKNTAQTKEILR